jgi:hypothetical protein
MHLMQQLQQQHWAGTVAGVAYKAGSRIFRQLTMLGLGRS